MSRRVDHHDVEELYRSGVDAVNRISSTISASEWPELACGSWSATDTARHLCSVAHWYHDWLDRALDNDTTRPFQAEEIDSKTADALTRYQDLDGATAISEFTHSATAYLDRVEDHWETPFSYPFGEVTAGLHIGVAAVEWNIHAWDLSRVTANEYTPDEPDKLLLAAALCVSAAEGGLRGAAIHTLAPLAARRHPWKTLLVKAGRGEYVD